MAKKESIVPGLGKKQAAVLMNEHARQLEHKRHLEELGFPKEVEPDFARYAPVSYDDENPTPSKIVNQAGQDLGDPNKDDSSHYKEYKYEPVRKELIDISSIVKEAVDEVFLSKEPEPYEFDPTREVPLDRRGYVTDEGVGSGQSTFLGQDQGFFGWKPFDALQSQGVTAGERELESKESWKNLGIPSPFDLAAQVLGDWFTTSSKEDVEEIARISTIPPSLRSSEQRGDLKTTLDRQFQREFGIKYDKDGKFDAKNTRFATVNDMKLYFDTLDSGSRGVNFREAKSFIDKYKQKYNLN